MKNKLIKNITLTAVFASFAICLSYVEMFFPPLIPIPGVKLGFSNIAVLCALSLLGRKNAFLVCIIKSLSLFIISANPISFILSLSGGLLSMIMMCIAIKFEDKFLSFIGISIIGSVFHNVGQIISASIIMKSGEIFYYLSPLIIASILTGLLTGIICNFLIPFIKGLTLKK